MKIRNTLPYIILALIFIFFLIILSLSEGYYGGADSLTHYMFSKYSWQTPSYFLDHWAKPVFTLLSSPFAQFGIVGVSVFNILIGILTAFLCYRIVVKLNYNFPWYVTIITCFTPVYSINMLSGLTEILFGFFIIWAVYLCFYEHYAYAALVASFMPLVRTEGIIVLPIILLYLIIKKQYYALPLFLVGTILYSIVGYFEFKNIFWLITEMPYRGATDIYGTGPLFHFVKHSPGIFSGTIVILTSLGLTYLLYLFMKERNKNTDKFVLIVLPFIAYFSAHSVMWWSGIGNSLGLQRYMAAISPFTAIMSMTALNTIFSLIQSKKQLKRIYYLFLIVLLFILIPYPIKRYNLPQKLSGADKVIREASDFIIDNGLIKHKIYYYDPAFFYFLNINPNDTSQCKEMVYDPNNPEYKINEGSIVIWDAHFSPNQKLDKNTMLSSKYFKLIEMFKPDNPFKIFNREYEILIFQRIKQSNTVNNHEYQYKKHIPEDNFNQIYFQGFESKNSNDIEKLTREINQNKMLKLDSSMEFALTYSFPNKMKEKNIYCEIEILIEDSLVKKHPILVVEKRNKNKITDYFSKNIIHNVDSTKWKKITLEAKIDSKIRKNDEVRIYIWNMHKISCYLDNYFIATKN